MTKAVARAFLIFWFFLSIFAHVLTVIDVVLVFLINPVITFSYLLTSAAGRYIEIKRYSCGLTGKKNELKSKEFRESALKVQVFI